LDIVNPYHKDKTFDVFSNALDQVFILSLGHKDHKSQLFFRIELYGMIFCVQINQFFNFIIWQADNQTE